jgi:hypothetical protein
MPMLILMAAFILMPILLFKRYFPEVYRAGVSFLRWIVRALWGSSRGWGERGGQARLNPRARQRRYRNG